MSSLHILTQTRTFASRAATSSGPKRFLYFSLYMRFLLNMVFHSRCNELKVPSCGRGGPLPPGLAGRPGHDPDPAELFQQVRISK
jgi:hypothetical protein